MAGGWRSLFRGFAVLGAPSFPVCHGTEQVCGKGGDFGPAVTLSALRLLAFIPDLHYVGSIFTSTPHKTVDKLVLL